MDEIRIKPWVGNNFSSPKLNSNSILVLGESHYSDSSSVSSEFTRNLVKNYISGEINKSRFWTNVAQLVSGIHHSSSKFDKSKIWHDFAFYNYIQSIVGDKPRIEPELKQFRESEEAFFQVIEEHKPKIVIALGSRLYNRMYPLYEKKVKISNNKSARIYTLNNHKFLCAHVRHPSAGFSFKEWHPILKKCQKWLQN